VSSPDGPELSDGQRHSIGVHVMTMQDIVQRLRVLGVTSATLGELDAELSRIEQESRAIRPRTGREVQGLLSEAFVLAAEFNARAFKAYGSVTPESGAWLDERGGRLQSLMQRLMDEV
jgi:hypothetical protein